MRQALSILATLWLLGGFACKEPPAEEANKIPITTSSEEALQDFLKGREASERLKDASQYYETAIAKDPEFALAHLFLGFARLTTQNRSAHLEQAAALSDQVSQGERLLILGLNVGGTDPAEQGQYLEELVQAYPQDERAHLYLGDFYHWFRQDTERAVEEYKKAIEIAPEYPPTYNAMGYAYRELGKYEEAEQAFAEYIELIPDEANPYDSYAELLMKLGRFDDSIKSYRKALSVDPEFTSSYIGIAANRMYQANYEEARAELGKMSEQSKIDEERQFALEQLVVTCVDEGDLEKALQVLDQHSALAEATRDPTELANSVTLRGDVLSEMGRYDEALVEYEKATKLVESADLLQGFKGLFMRGCRYRLSRLALMRDDLEQARAEADELLADAESVTDLQGIQRAHEVKGMIALHEKDFEGAIPELEQTDPGDPYAMFQLALAYQGKGNLERTREYCEKVANHNEIPTLRYARVRKDALEMLEAM